MMYMGGKAQIAKHIVAFLNQHRTEGQLFVEPFLGGCNILPLMDLPKWGNEINKSIGMFYVALRDGWVPPRFVPEEEYQDLKDEKDSVLRGFVGIACSFGGKWFGGYARGTGIRNYALNGYNTAMKTAPKLQGALITWMNYQDMTIPDGSLVYCDPPYAGTTGYNKTKFDHDAFWQWVRDLSSRCTVFVSEYSAPPDFQEVWRMERGCGLKQGKNGVKAIRVERIFQYKGTKQ
jgi:DNA adenine methylase